MKTEALIEKVLDFSAQIINTEHPFQKSSKLLEVLEIITFCCQREQDVAVINEVCTILLLGSDRIECGKCKAKLKIFVSMLYDLILAKDLAINVRKSCYDADGVRYANFAQLFVEVGAITGRLSYYNRQAIPSVFPLPTQEVTDKIFFKKDLPGSIRIVSVFPSLLAFSNLDIKSKGLKHFLDYCNRRGFNAISIPINDTEPLDKITSLQEAFDRLNHFDGVILNGDKGMQSAKELLKIFGYNNGQIGEIEWKI